MNSVRFLVSLSVAVLFISCGGGSEASVELHDETVSIVAGKGAFIRMTLASEELENSLLYRDEIPIE